MGKFDWLFPPPQQQSILDLYVNTPCSIFVSNGDFFQTDQLGYVKITYPMGRDYGFKLVQEGYRDYLFDHSFNKPLATLTIEMIKKHPDPPPVDDNHLDEAIDPKYGAVSSAYFEDAILIQDRTIVYKWGNPDEYQDNLASVCRVWTNLIWGDWVTRNGFEWLDKWCRELNTSTAQSINSDMAVSNLLSYTTPPDWVYSGGKDKDGIYRWPKQFKIIAELYGKPVPEVIREAIFDKLTGSFQAWMISDGTMRIGSTIRDLYKFARLLFNEGAWNGEQLISKEYARRTLAGGPNGTGAPFNLEGYQTHLIVDGSAWEMEGELTGVPNGFMARSSKSYIIGIPSIGLIMAGKGPEQFQDVFLPQIVDIMMGRAVRALKAPRAFKSLVDVD